MRQQRTGLLVMAMMFMMVLARVFSGGPAQAADPDFTNVPDILNGWRQLLRTDDLALIRRTQTGASGSLLLTDNSHITSTQPTSPISSPDAAPSDHHRSADVRVTLRRGGECGDDETTDHFIGRSTEATAILLRARHP